MNKQFIYENFLLLSQQQEKLINNALQINKIFESFFKGATDSRKEEDNKMPLISIQGDNEMKFKGKTIHKNTKCNTWYTRYRQDGKQYYISGKTKKKNKNIPPY